MRALLALLGLALLLPAQPAAATGAGACLPSDVPASPVCAGASALDRSWPLASAGVSSGLGFVSAWAEDDRDTAVSSWGFFHVPGQADWLMAYTHVGCHGDLRCVDAFGASAAAVETRVAGGGVGAQCWRACTEYDAGAGAGLAGGPGVGGYVYSSEGKPCANVEGVGFCA